MIKATIAGMAISDQPGKTPNTGMKSKNTANAIAKSTVAASTALSGTISRGKYTFVTSRSSPMTLLGAELTALLKKVHVSKPAKTNRGYGTSASGELATRPRNNANAAIVASGCRTAHAAPSTVCL